MRKQSPPMAIPKLKNEMNIPGCRHQKKMQAECDKYAPQNAADQYKLYEGGFFARKSNESEQEIYGTELVYRFYERPYDRVGVDGNVVHVKPPGFKG